MTDAHDPPETYGIPRMQPIVDELLSAIAILMTENDALRTSLGREISNGRREFTARDLANGNSIGPLAMIQDGKLIIRLES